MKMALDPLCGIETFFIGNYKDGWHNPQWKDNQYPGLKGHKLYKNIKCMI